MDKHERQLWIDHQLRNRDYLETDQITEYCECSKETVRRDIKEMKNKRAPIKSDRSISSYYYTDKDYHLPNEWPNEDELIGLVLAKRLATTIPDGTRKKQLKRLFENIYKKNPHQAVRQLDSRITLKNICYYSVKPDVFNTVLRALYLDRKLHFRYKPVFVGTVSERTVCPLHLILYRGNWHLAAFCELKNENRLFTLSRIHEPEILSHEEIPRWRLDTDIPTHLDAVHGIFLSENPIPVTLRFSPAMAAFVREQVWFPQQKLKDNDDGSLELTFPVGDFPEIIQEILGYGPEVEVLAPDSLREEIKNRVSAMACNYGV